MRVQPLESTRRVGCSQLVKLSWRRENSEKCEVVLPETWEAAFRLLRDELCDLQMRPPPPFHRHKAYPEWNQGIRRDGGFHQEKSTLPKRHGETLVLCVCVCEWERGRERSRAGKERESEAVFWIVWQRLAFPLVEGRKKSLVLFDVTSKCS